MLQDIENIEIPNLVCAHGSSVVFNSGDAEHFIILFKAKYYEKASQAIGRWVQQGILDESAAHVVAQGLGVVAAYPNLEIAKAVTLRKLNELVN